MAEYIFSVYENIVTVDEQDPTKGEGRDDLEDLDLDLSTNPSKTLV